VEVVLERGLALCRRGEWDFGLTDLGKLAENDTQGDLPSIFYSYLGYGIALRQKRIREGLRLCKHAVKLEFYQPENYLNLARTYLLAENRRKAYEAVSKGLQMDRGHKGLRALLQHMGARRKPVIPFLSRNHLVNRFLGRIRHDLKSSGKKKRR
jgi:tetratricopeptide (TPR) repeat protein